MAAVCSMIDIWIEGTFGPLFVGIAHELACSRNRLFFAGKVGPGGRVVYKDNVVVGVCTIMA